MAFVLSCLCSRPPLSHRRENILSTLPKLLTETQLQYTFTSFSPPRPVCFKSPKKPSEECRLEKEKPTPYLQKGPSPQKNTGRKNGGRFTILTQSAGKSENHLENLVTVFPLMFKTLLIKRRSHTSHLHILEVTANSFGRPSRFAMDFRYRVRSHKNNFDNLPEAPHR